jgi:hypothetical protein
MSRTSYRVEVRDTPTAPWSELLRVGSRQSVAERAADMAVMRKQHPAHAARVTVAGLVVYEVTSKAKV